MSKNLFNEGHPSRDEGETQDNASHPDPYLRDLYTIVDEPRFSLAPFGTVSYPADPRTSFSGPTHTLMRPTAKSTPRRTHLIPESPPHYRPAQLQKRPSVILSSETLLPIPADTGDTIQSDSNSRTPASQSPAHYHRIPALRPCSLEDAKREGVYGWGPTSGPAGCKLLIFLRHTSPLAVKLLSLVHGQEKETRFWIDFDGKKIPAAPHKFYFNEDDYAPENVNVDGLGRDREVLLALVPVSIRRRVPLWLHVVSERGVIEHNVHLGYFQYDDNVPLKTYSEIKWKGQALVNFLTSERPHVEDVRIPREYMASETTAIASRDCIPLAIASLKKDHQDTVPTHVCENHTISSHKDIPVINKSAQSTRRKKQKSAFSGLFQLSHSINLENGATRSTTTTKSRTIQSPKSPSAISPRKVSSVVRTQTPKSVSSAPIGPSPSQTMTRQQYVTIKFTDPTPSSLGMPALNTWTLFERSRKRRLVAFTCFTDNPKFTAHFTAQPIVHLGLAPPSSKVVSCIYVPPEASQLRNKCIITSYDFINLISWMLSKPAWFTVDERNRVRRNLEIFNPQTLHKEGAYDIWDLFKQVTGYQHPKPWNIQKDFKVFDWELIEAMMKEIVKKYTVVVGKNEIGLPVDTEMNFEQDDIEQELLQANKDLLEDIARLNEHQTLAKNDSAEKSTSTESWKKSQSGQMLPISINNAVGFPWQAEKSEGTATQAQNPSVVPCVSPPLAIPQSHTTSNAVHLYKPFSMEYTGNWLESTYSEGMFGNMSTASGYLFQPNNNHESISLGGNLPALDVLDVPDGCFEEGRHIPSQQEDGHDIGLIYALEHEWERESAAGDVDRMFLENFGEISNKELASAGGLGQQRYNL